MTVSVIIPTYQGAERIEGVLRALALQIKRDFEIVVVIDGSSDSTAQIVRDLGMNLKVIEQNNRGRAGARNAGAGASSADLLIFYDDDMLPAPDSVVKHVRFHENHSDSLLTGNSPQRINPNQTDFNNYRTQLSEKWTRHFRDGVQKLNRENLFVTAANFSINRQQFVALGGFDEHLTDAEDRELGIRAFLKGLSCYFDSGNIAWHNESLTCRQYVRRLRDYAAANRKVADLHPEFASTRHVALNSRYLIFRSAIWIDVIDRTGLLRVLPRQIRYRLYDAVTFALSERYPDIAV